VVDTPVTGNVVSHRVLLQLTPGAGRPKEWTAPSARADVEPALNHFLGGLIGPPGETWVQVVTDAASPTHVADVSLTALEVQPIDLLAILASGLDDGLTELTVRVLDTLRPVDVRENEPAPALRLDLDRHPALAKEHPVPGRDGGRCWRWRPSWSAGPGPRRLRTTNSPKR
jgi:hypothetical protein